MKFPNGETFEKKNSYSNIPILQYSNTPIIQYSNGFLRYALCALLFIAIGLGSWGCASKNSQQNFLKEVEYRRKLESQKADKNPVKLPEMTAEEYEKLGDQSFIQKNIDLAFVQYNKALRLNPDQIRLRYKIGRLFLEKGLTEDAKREFQEVLKVNPNYALAYDGMGRVYFHLCQYQEAEENFKKAIKFENSLWQSHNFLGLVYDRQGHFEAAIIHYKAAVTIRPDDPSLLNNLGTSLFLKKDYELAVKAFTEALRMDGSNSRVHNNLALALCKLERYQEAFEAFRKAGEEATAYYNLGCIYMMEGKNREAVAAFEKAIEIKPEFYAKAYENLKKARADANITSVK